MAAVRPHGAARHLQERAAGQTGRAAPQPRHPVAGARGPRPVADAAPGREQDAARGLPTKVRRPAPQGNIPAAKERSLYFIVNFLVNTNCRWELN